MLAQLRNALKAVATLLALVTITVVGGYMQLNGNFDWFDGRPICEHGRPYVNLGTAIMISFGVYPRCSR